LIGSRNVSPFNDRADASYLCGPPTDRLSKTPDHVACIELYLLREADALVGAGTSLAETCNAAPGISPARG
jgi:hypothetical protein